MIPVNRKRKREDETTRDAVDLSHSEEAISTLASTPLTSSSLQTDSLTFSLSEHFKILLSNQQNKAALSKKVQDYLTTDFHQKENPQEHFYHNRNIIMEDFKKKCGMIVVNEKAQLVGFMTWIIHSHSRIEVNIVEVAESYRGKGIFKRMLATLTNQYESLHILTAGVIGQSHAVFSRLGWTKVEQDRWGSWDRQYFYKIIKPMLEPVDELPEGLVIATCIESYYKVRGHLSDYQSSMKYYKIDLDEQQNLISPLLIPTQMDILNSREEGYIGLYCNKKLIKEGKPRHIFEKFMLIGEHLLISNFDLTENTKQQLTIKGFFKEESQQSLEAQPILEQANTTMTIVPSANRYARFASPQLQIQTASQEEAPEESHAHSPSLS